MADLKQTLEFNTPQEDELKSFIETNIVENLNHARHVETEIHTFTGIYMAVAAGVLAFNFSGREITFAIIVHTIILFGGLVAMALLGRWYTAFDTFMGHADFLSFIEHELIFGNMRVEEVPRVWDDFTKAFKTAVESSADKPKDAAIALMGEEMQKKYKASKSFFAFSIPHRGAKSQAEQEAPEQEVSKQEASDPEKEKKGPWRPRTRDFIMFFHGVILISILIILIKDLYGIVSVKF